MILLSKIDCLVIGGGLAGSMAALRLAEAGREVLLLERERGPRHKVCGEFLSAEAIGYLRAAGVDPLRYGAQQVNGLRFSAGARVVETPLPFAAMALSRAVIDEQLLRCAESSGCAVAGGVAVERLVRASDAWHAHTEDGRTVQADNVFLASGKHDLRGWARPSGVQNDLIGFKMHWRLAPGQSHELARHIELHQFAGGYGGLVAVEDGVANLSVVARRSLFRELGGWPALLAHMRKHNTLLDARLADSEPAWERPMAISSIPYGFLAHSADELWRVGDQVAVIPSFTGDGMAIAMHSACMAAEMMLAGRGVGEYQQRLGAQLRGGMRIATALSKLMASGIAGLVAPFAMAVLPYLLEPIARATRIPSSALLLQE
ncbi:NAD(P)/FAD-dependent oxidoreductase [Occallatibacter riparius]|uniref:FAD-dependent monooxygenase n=1 Tax=Occallatibacter riparius TaxID=1002689 RepID=A0A9J7BSL5_9BACT|nr:FAD-dependent oxidoreductase [Occallatibacter riparius]UWZ84021.1 FAD-dependent monooxygenase [Occallatibacter riparius]